MSVPDKPMTKAMANRVFDVLVERAGAFESDRRSFIIAETELMTKHGICTEFRFIGALGFGGKFWRTTGHRPDGTWGTHWYINCYSEDRTEETTRIQDEVNPLLWALLQEQEGGSDD